MISHCFICIPLNINKLVGIALKWLNGCFSLPNHFRAHLAHGYIMRGILCYLTYKWDVLLQSKITLFTIKACSALGPWLSQTWLLLIFNKVTKMKNLRCNQHVSKPSKNPRNIYVLIPPSEGETIHSPHKVHLNQQKSLQRSFLATYPGLESMPFSLTLSGLTLFFVWNFGYA